MNRHLFQRNLLALSLVFVFLVAQTSLGRPAPDLSQTQGPTSSRPFPPPRYIMNINWGSMIFSTRTSNQIKMLTLMPGSKVIVTQ